MAGKGEPDRSGTRVMAKLDLRGARSQQQLQMSAGIKVLGKLQDGGECV